MMPWTDDEVVREGNRIYKNGFDKGSFAERARIKKALEPVLAELRKGGTWTTDEADRIDRALRDEEGIGAE